MINLPYSLVIEATFNRRQMLMDLKFIEKLLQEGESSSLDFKRDQYPFEGADDNSKSELLKDIVAFANAWRQTEAYILIGVEEISGGKSNLVGISNHIDDAKIQQFVNSKTNRPVGFSYQSITMDGVQVGVLRIEVQERPIFLKKDYGRLRAREVYIRRGSSTDTADPAEVHKMGASSAREEKPQFEEKLKVNLKGGGAASSVPPFGTGEPFHFEIDLTIMNDGSNPVFIVAAVLKDPTESRSFDFPDVCSEVDPLQPGGRRKSKLKFLYHKPFPQHPWQARTPERLFEDNLITYKLMRFIWRKESAFHIETGRGSHLVFPIVDCCDGKFLGWPDTALPKDIFEAVGNKTLEEFEEEEQAAWKKIKTEQEK